jgi:predicted Rossmann fold nucleotide-binding protein DprA/Smf involved in DNA uptake
MPPTEPRTAEEVAAAAGEPIGRVMAALLELELAGRLRRMPGGCYYRTL